VSWESLGRQGRTITGTGPSAKAITEFTGSPAKEPIRAYAGTLSATDVEARAELAVDDLQRAGGFDRGNLLVATHHRQRLAGLGRGRQLRVQTGGDSAIVAMQYSYLPSWLSFLVDQQEAREAGRQLFDAVYDRWSKLPPDHRPRLYVFGLSLGSFGGETAFSGEYDLRNRTAGTLFAGPPNFNTLYRGSPTAGMRVPARWSRSTRVAVPSASPTTWPPASRRLGRLGRAAGPVPAAPLRPDRLVEPAADMGPAGLDGRAATAATCSAR
jgi:uncharacterized membrane protein